MGEMGQSTAHKKNQEAKAMCPGTCSSLSLLLSSQQVPVLLLGPRVTAQGVKPTLILLLRQSLVVFHAENLP